MQIKPLIQANIIIDDSVLNAIAHFPTGSLHSVVEDRVFSILSDVQFMRIATCLAMKSYSEGGCPIGAAIINNETRKILGKGHNTLVQENHPYNHGETSALRDAGRHDFSRTTLFTTLTPCDICTALVINRGFKRIVIGDLTSVGEGNVRQLREAGIQVDVIEDPVAIELFGRYRFEQPELELEDWKGLAAVIGVAEGNLG